MKHTSYKAIFISPHLDDVVFSCAGEVARMRALGPVCVMNVFTKFQNAADGAPVPMGLERYAEEQKASKLLDYDSINLGELDAFFRDPRFKSLGNIFRWHSKTDDTYIENLKNKISDLISSLQFERIYLPLGVGWHVDHLLAHQIFSELVDPEKVLYYEDAPYCLIEGATQARLYQLGVLKDLSFWGLWWKGSISFWKSGMVQNIEPSIVRYLAFPITTYYLFRLLKGHLKNRNQYSLASVVSAVGESLERKFRAIELYSSQVKEFFVDPTDLRLSYLRYAKSIDEQVSKERFWVKATLLDRSESRLRNTQEFF